MSSPSATPPLPMATVSSSGCIHGLAGLSNVAANAWPLLMICNSDQCYADLSDFLDQIEDVKAFSKFSVKATGSDRGNQATPRTKPLSLAAFVVKVRNGPDGGVERSFTMDPCHGHGGRRIPKMEMQTQMRPRGAPGCSEEGEKEH